MRPLPSSRRALLPLCCLLLFASCEGDEPSVALDVTAVALGGGEVAINLYNDGETAGVVHGCESGPMTAVSRWEGSDFVYWGTLNSGCPAHQFRDYALERYEELEYVVSLPSGRYRFTVQFIVEGRFGEGSSRSNPVDV